MRGGGGRRHEGRHVPPPPGQPPGVQAHRPPVLQSGERVKWNYYTQEYKAPGLGLKFQFLSGGVTSLV